MASARTRREFLSSVGQGMLVASVGTTLAHDMGLSRAYADNGNDALTFGALEPLVTLMQETPQVKLLPTLVERLRQGTSLQSLVAAGALANARTFGGEDYIGFHTLMAMAPAYYMSQELPTERQPLPVFKVLYRNTNRIHEHGGRASEVLKQVSNPMSPGTATAEDLRAAVHARDVKLAEATFAGLASGSPADALSDLMVTVDDHTEVHRVVLPYRAWDLLGILGQEHALTLLRQSVRYCVDAERREQTQQDTEPRRVLTKAFDDHKLAGKQPGERPADDAWVEALSQTIYRATPEQAADAAAAALAEGFAPATICEAISLAANQLVLRDQGRPPSAESPGKPVGSVHGDSIGVHACDSANAWRNIARVGNTRNAFASVILGAYQVALDRRGSRGSDFLNLEPLPLRWQLERLTDRDPNSLLAELDTAIRGNLQSRASAIVHRYGELGHPERAVFDVLLKYAISEDGALHGEKYYRTVSEEFAITRPKFRWRQLTALARVTASEYGRPAAGCDEARSLLQLT